MDASAAVEQSAANNEETLQSAAKVYSLPERGFAKSGASLVLQVAVGGILAIGLALVAHYTIPEVEWGRITTFSGLIILAVLLCTPLLLRRQKQLWKQVRVRVGDQSVEVSQGDGWMPDMYLLPQAHVRVDRDQVTNIRETSYGLAIVTGYDPEALVIPNRLAPVDYQEIVKTLSKWRMVERRLDSARTETAQTDTRANGMKGPEHLPVFYERGTGVVQVGALIGAVAGTVPGVIAIVGWAKDREVLTDLAWVILLGYTINLFMMIIGTQIGFAWFDYGMALAGVRMAVRSSLWIGVGASVFVFALAYMAGLDLVLCIVATVIGCTVIGILYGVLGQTRWNAQPAFDSPITAVADSAYLPATTGMTAGGPIEGAYRFTYGEYFVAAAYFIMSQPRSQGRPRLLSTFLPRSVNHGDVRAAFSSHSNRNKILRFVVDDGSIRWLIDGCPERTLGWNQVKQVVYTRKGLILCSAGHDFDWLPFHAFAAKDGVKACIELAKRHAVYREIAKYPSSNEPGV